MRRPLLSPHGASLLAGAAAEIIIPGTGYQPEEADEEDEDESDFVPGFIEDALITFVCPVCGTTGSNLVPHSDEFPTPHRQTFTSISPNGERRIYFKAGVSTVSIAA